MNTDNPEAVDLNAASDDDLKQMGLPPAFTLDELKSFMTKEEIERELASDDPVVAGAADDPEGGEADEDDDDPDGAGDDGAEDAGADAAADGDASDNADPVDEPPVPAAAPEPDPVIDQIDTSEHQQVIDGIGDARKALREEYSDGGMSDTEFDKRMDALADQLMTAKAAVQQAERDQASQAEAYQAAWYQRTGAIMQQTPEFTDISPVPELKGYSVAQLFNEACVHVTSDVRFEHLSMSQKAEQAAAITRYYYKELTGKDLGATAAPAATPAPAPKKDEKTPAQLAQERGKRPAPIQTLGGVTAASETELDDGRFSAVDTAIGIDAEKSYDRMSAAEQEAYLKGA